MALVVETGLGSLTADSYASVATADAYWAARPGPDATAWAAAQLADKEGALRSATEYLDREHLGGRTPMIDGQGLAWPYGDDFEVTISLLRLVERATVMIAPLALSGPLLAQAAAEPLVVQRTDKVGEISESRTFARPVFDSTVVAGRDLTFLSRMLAPLGTGGLVIGHRVLG